MSTKSSPHTTPPTASSAVRRRRRTGTTGRKRVSAPRPEPAPTVPETWSERLRHYLPFAAAPSVVAALAVVALCLALVLLSGSPMAYLPAAIGEMWLVSHGVPATFDGVTLGLTPMLPPVAVAALVAQRVRVATRKRVSILDLGAIAALGLGIPLTLTFIALFMVTDASAVYPLAPPHPLAAVLLPLVVHGLGMIVGIGPIVWRALARRVGAPDVVIDTARTASAIVVRLLAAAAVVFLGLLIAGGERVSTLIDAFPTLPGTGVATLIALSILYLPNAVLAMLSAMLGGSLEYAGASASLFSVDPVALPPLPLFAAVPGDAAVWAPVLMLVPAAVLAHFFATRECSVKEVLLAAAWAAVILFVLMPFGAGGAGAYGYIGAHPVATPALVLGWVAAIGVAVLLIARLRHPAAPEPEPEEEPEPEAVEASQSEKPTGGSTKWVPPTDDGGHAG
ncbi:hypothetical protein G7Y29_03160 [Corynebacterium qintianiae]|uniref:Uncharacterized protein n=1 Tax=Corynebacterium qintianiae TaxID=2709392 RepID=A0A7T0KPF2_9CORY|nr:DUF6350 family protein [Corynebacterium qintianiae]QPK83809.1 hypothetical protein G7Y29_03160 [Corynebacterium qintianiae]